MRVSSVICPCSPTCSKGKMLPYTCFCKAEHQRSDARKRAASHWGLDSLPAADTSYSNLHQRWFCSDSAGLEMVLDHAVPADHVPSKQGCLDHRPHSACLLHTWQDRGRGRRQIRQGHSAHRPVPCTWTPVTDAESTQKAC